MSAKSLSGEDAYSRGPLYEYMMLHEARFGHISSCCFMHSSLFGPQFRISSKANEDFIATNISISYMRILKFVRT